MGKVEFPTILTCFSGAFAPSDLQQASIAVDRDPPERNFNGLLEAEEVAVETDESMRYVHAPV